MEGGDEGGAAIAAANQRRHDRRSRKMKRENGRKRWKNKMAQTTDKGFNVAKLANPTKERKREKDSRRQIKDEENRGKSPN